MVSDPIRIGNASAFWGDTPFAAAQLLRARAVDVLVFDYLAEITMSLLARLRLKDPHAGFAPDFPLVIGPLLPQIHQQGVRVIANAGGVNPLACRAVLEDLIQKSDLPLKVAVVLGDDLMDHQARLAEQDIRDMKSGKPLPDKLISANAYLGALPIVDALEAGADIVITGRCCDSSLALAPLMHHFGWQKDDYDLLAAGSLAGHIIECGAHCTGGNFTDWDQVPGFENVGFPVVTCFADGSFEVGKPPETGGLVTPASVGEQFVYEMGDPGCYILPDVVCDFSHVTLAQVGENRVRVQGAKGCAPTDSYKVAATYANGYRADVAVLIVGPRAAEKGRRVGEAILKRVAGLFKLRGFAPFSDQQIALLGNEHCYGSRGHAGASREVVLRLSVRHDDKKALGLFSREIAQAATATAPGLTGMIGGRPHPSPSVELFDFLIPKDQVQVRVLIGEQQIESVVPTAGGFRPELLQPAVYPSETAPVTESAVLLERLAWARSGDKGNDANIGVLAREPLFLPYLWAALTPDAVKAWFAELCEGPVLRWSLPKVNGLNLLLKDSLGGGGMASLRADPQGKAFAQMLLEMPIPVGAEVMAHLADLENHRSTVEV
ncbi:acyclic terpene utilization AtuA family protein [Acanthopleuribacter pedis]|uniref:DUF1446 domain-containing protein n=1 Tax=Acanthopleuribacter pedis TaxID=442870 RepID=A0A8J7QLP0_9BACT|nr:acyclic terpene utilization AtuA family protein [Acanthopleuribacter pedis]MBO1320603.1 DUF1446 domain-containing protein [Acanthopleuribacter pedis]